MDDFKHIRKKPMLSDKTRVYSNVMSRIKELETQKRSSTALWWRIAASILVVLAISGYSWLEMDTYLSRSLVLAKVQPEEFRTTVDQNCEYQINELMATLREAGFIIDDRKNLIQFSKQTVIRLNANNSPFYTDVSQFISTMAELYPGKFQQYSSGESVTLNAWHLKNDQRICQWMK